MKMAIEADLVDGRSVDLVIDKGRLVFGFVICTNITKMKDMIVRYNGHNRSSVEWGFGKRLFL